MFITIVLSSVTLDSTFGAQDTGGYHVAHQYRFSDTGSAGTLSFPMNSTPNGAVFALLSLAP